MVAAGGFGTKLPCIASHEGTGTVVATGSAVSDFKKGDRVMAGLPRNRCGHCHDCLGPDNFKHYCRNVKGYGGISVDGAFAEYMVADARESSKVPDKVSFETAAPLECAGVTIWRGVLQAGLKAGETIALVGAGGGLSHLGCQFARALGLQVIGIDARDEGLELAKTSGAKVVVDARQGKDKVIEEVHKVTNGMGADATINISDHAEAASLACAVTKMHGTMVQIAQPDLVSIPYPELIFRDVHVKGTLISSRAEAHRMLALVAEHNITVKNNPFFGLRDIPKLVELAHSGKMAGKGVVVIEDGEIEKVKAGKAGSL